MQLNGLKKIGLTDDSQAYAGDKMLILFFLQNAYRSEKYNFRNEKEWHRDLLRSHTGRRLSEMIPDGADVRVVNANPNIGNNADSCYNPDLRHMEKMIKKYSPDIICACGRMAQQGCSDLGIEFIAAPHPAWRALSKEITMNIKRMLEQYE